MKMPGCLTMRVSSAHRITEFPEDSARCMSSMPLLGKPFCAFANADRSMIPSTGRSGPDSGDSLRGALPLAYGCATGRRPRRCEIAEIPWLHGPKGADTRCRRASSQEATTPTATERICIREDRVPPTLKHDPVAFSSRSGANAIAGPPTRQQSAARRAEDYRRRFDPINHCLSQ